MWYDSWMPIRPVSNRDTRMFGVGTLIISDEGLDIPHITRVRVHADEPCPRCGTVHNRTIYFDEAGKKVGETAFQCYTVDDFEMTLTP
jgi:hypothetical protein